VVHFLMIVEGPNHVAGVPQRGPGQHRPHRPRKMRVPPWSRLSAVSCVFTSVVFLRPVRDQTRRHGGGRQGSFSSSPSGGVRVLGEWKSGCFTREATSEGLHPEAVTRRCFTREATLAKLHPEAVTSVASGIDERLAGVPMRLRHVVAAGLGEDLRRRYGAQQKHNRKAGC
jgi:hypothetical protein